MTVEIVDFYLIGTQSGHHRGTRWVAKWKLIVSACEPNSRRCQLVDVGRLGNQVTVAAQVARQIVDRNEKHIGLLGRLLLADSIAGHRENH